jgi:hypothetical protein
MESRRRNSLSWGGGLYWANLNAENPLGTMQSIEHTLHALDKLAEQEQ